MDKKYLSSLPVPPKEPSEPRQLVAEIIDTKKEQVLRLIVYNQSGYYTHQVFLTKTMWHTLSANGVWSKKTIGGIVHEGEDYYRPYGFYFNENEYEIDNDSRNVIINYFDIQEGYYRNNILQMIQNYQTGINAEKASRERYKKEKQETKIFELVPQLPQDINEYVRNTLLPENNYAFMQPKKGKNPHKEAYCTYCKETIEISADWKHNEIGYCESCGSEVVFKSANIKRGKMKDKTSFYIWQRAGADVFVRFFNVIVDYNHPIGKEDYIYNEYARYFITNKKVHFWTQRFSRIRSYYGYYEPRDNPLPCGWVRKKRFYSLLPAASPMYNHDLSEIMQGSRLENLHYDTLPQITGVDTLEYINMWTHLPAVEYLAKANMNRLLRELKYNIQSKKLNLKAKKPHEIFGLSHEDLMLVKKNNCSLEEIELLKSIRSKGYKVDEADFYYIQEFCGKLEEVQALLQYISLKRIVNYIKKQYERYEDRYESPKTVLIDWYDYLSELKQLEYDIPSLLRPANLGEKHTELSRLIDDIANPEINRKIAKRKEKLEKKLSFSDGEYMIVIPESGFEIKEEGKHQDHCVGSYVNRHAQGKTTILFLRKVREPYQSFYTIEYDEKTNRIVQCRGYSNLDTPERPQVDIFIKNWLAHIVNKKTKKKSA